MKIFGAFHQPDYNEQLVSLHSTKEGAEKALIDRYRYDDSETLEWIWDRIKFNGGNVQELEVKK